MSGGAWQPAAAPVKQWRPASGGGGESKAGLFIEKNLIRYKMYVNQ